MNPCGLIQLVCSFPACETPFEVMRPTTEDLERPLCPSHKKARLVENEETGCDRVGEPAGA
jgi:hypothetical protein